MDAKCPLCEKKARVSDDMGRVHCGHCGYDEGYEQYLERMKDRVTSIVTDFKERTDSGAY